MKVIYYYYILKSINDPTTNTFIFIIICKQLNLKLFIKLFFHNKVLVIISYKKHNQLYFQYVFIIIIHFGEKAYKI